MQRIPYENKLGLANTNNQDVCLGDDVLDAFSLGVANRHRGMMPFQQFCNRCAYNLATT